MGKTLGEVAEEGFNAALDGLTESKTGAEARAIGDKAWQAAAEAVVKHLGEVPCGIDCGRSRAVIEAAKAFVEANNSVDGDEWSTYHALETAVEALQEVENE